MERPALSRTQIRQIFQYGVMMEAFFQDKATDIEGVIQGDQLYFVQARPVHRPTLAPTYLDLVKAEDAGAMLQQIRGERLLLGKGSFLSISNRTEVLFAPSMLEAQKAFRKDQHRLLLVTTNTEPSNSHQVVNLSQWGVPCLYVTDPAETERLLARVDESHPLAACIQSATLALWDSSKGKLEGFIAKGFTEHPAKIALSLPVASIPSAPFSAPPEVRDLFFQLTMTRAQETALDRLEAHPLRTGLKAKRQEIDEALAGTAYPLKSPMRTLETLTALDTEVDRAFRETRAVYRSSGQQRRLLQAKILKTLMLSSPEAYATVGSYSLLDVAPLSASAKTLIAYQGALKHPAHFLDLVLDGQQAPYPAIGSPF